MANYKMAAVCCCFLALAACSKKNTPDLEAGTNVGNAKPGSQQDFTVNVGDRIYFAEDQSTLAPEAQETLRKQAAWLSQYPAVTVQIEGHADERGTREYNLALGERRAQAAMDYLIALGIDSKRLKTISYGKERPVCTDANEACRSQNRRSVSTLDN
jgi:peptidoglycan-associated lipoprotein